MVDPRRQLQLTDPVDLFKVGEVGPQLFTVVLTQGLCLYAFGPTGTAAHFAWWQKCVSISAAQLHRIT